MSNGVIDPPEVVVSPDGTSTGIGSVDTRGDGVNEPVFGSGGSRYFDQHSEYPFPNNAVVTINGALYWEWESVLVTAEIGGVPPIQFRLSTSEQEPWPEDWAFLRIRPDDQCTVHLDGQRACDGKVVTRQVYYDARQHAVQIQGWDKTGILNHASADSKTGEMKNKISSDMIKELAQKHGVQTKMLGTVPSFKIPRFANQPGEAAREAIEKLARHAGLHVFGTPSGELLLIGEGMGTGYGELIEGRDILIGREQISSLEKPQNMAQSQSAGSDNVSMGEAAHGQHADGADGGGDMATSMFQRVLSELPSSGIDQLKQRARIEDNVGDQLKIIVTLTVLGWQRPSGGLWWPYDIVYVDAPMLIMKRPLILRKVTFSQDNATGSRSELELVNPTALGASKAQSGGE
jgi:prophage tail gpP-like protein